MRYVNKIKVSANITLRRYRKGIPSITNHIDITTLTSHLTWFPPTPSPNKANICQVIYFPSL